MATSSPALTRPSRIRYALTTYPLVFVTLAAAAVGGILHMLGQPTAARWIISALAVALAAWLAKGMVDDLRAGTYGIDLLAVLAITSTVILGEYWAALVVCLMLTGGEALEDYARSRAKRELTTLLSSAPHETTRLLPSGDTERIYVEDVAIGDVLSVRPGELVPVDGILESDGATLDESSLTGESIPVDRERGAELLSGALNGQRAFTMRATATAADSQYQRIIELVRQAQDSKAPFVRLADRVAVPFTLVALIIAGVAWFISGEPIRFAEVLVVATPCPLIIAAPVAFMGGMSRAAKLGIIVKDSASLEQLSKLRSAAFDKTGTLTQGIPEVVAVHPANGHSPSDLLAAAAALEAHSNHPLAVAIVTKAQTDGIDLPAVSDAKEVTAQGMTGIVSGQRVEVGKPDFAHATEDDTLPYAESAGVYVGIDGTYAGFIELADQVRPDAHATLTTLHDLGVSPLVMLTGDHSGPAKAVAAELPIDEFRYGLLPADKVQAVADMPLRPVLMVGDGINDAPVLAAADVGVAMGARGAAAASESADVVLVTDSVSRVARAVLVGKRTMRIAWQAIAIGVGLSVFLMLIATTGIMPAVVGAWMQEVVDLACILWALLAMRPGKNEHSMARVQTPATTSPKMAAATER